MELTRRVILVLAIVSVAAVTFLPCSADEKNEEDIWTEEGPRGPGRGPRPGPGRGPGRGPRRFEPTNEEIDRVMKSLQESNPEKAKELVELRKKDPEKFQAELRQHMFERRIESMRSRRRTEFIEWLDKAAPRVSQELAGLKDKDPEIYTKRYELVWRKYGRIFDESRRFPELAKVLLADLELEDRQEVLVSKIKSTKSEKEKQELMAQLEEVVSDKYDLLIRRKQIVYEQLLIRLKELQEEINRSREEIDKWRDKTIKAQNVQERIKYLTEETRRGFRWR